LEKWRWPMSEIDPATVARRLTPGERSALMSLPARDPGGLPDEVWWQYYALIDQGLSVASGNFWMRPSRLGEAVLAQLRESPA
jgi:hypothetical protein